MSRAARDPTASRPAGDDPLAEASDPATPPERLRALATRAPWLDRSLSVHDETGARRLHAAVLRNPSLPLDVLRDTLLGRAATNPPPRWAFEAWHNPSVALLLMTEPDPGYHPAALRMLLWYEQRAGLTPSGTETLADEVAWWAEWGRHWHRHAPSLRCRAFARHLAGLFGLPWPDERPSR